MLVIQGDLEEKTKESYFVSMKDGCSIIGTKKHRKSGMTKVNGDVFGLRLERSISGRRRREVITLPFHK